MFPYKIRRVEQLRSQKLTGRKIFATWCFDNMRIDSNVLWRIVFLDECVFHMSGIANNQNARFWGSDSPRLVQDHQINSANITVCCAVYLNGVLNPYYFDNETMRGKYYHHLLSTYVWNSKHLFPSNHLIQKEGIPLIIPTYFAPFFMSHFRVLGEESIAYTINPLDHLIWPHLTLLVAIR